MGAFRQQKPRATFIETPGGKVQSGGGAPGEWGGGYNAGASGVMHTCCRQNDSDGPPEPPKAFAETWGIK